ncbi:MAG: hypothetical protein ACI4XH_09510 [Acutalibacteraceae bacterium]
MKQKLICIILSVAVLICSVLPVMAKGAVVTDCGGECEYCPTVIIPGIFQSDVKLYDENGNVALNSDGEPYSKPFFMESSSDITSYALKKVLLPLISTLIFQRDINNTLANNFGEALGKILMGNVVCDKNGKPVKDIRAAKYDGSLAQLTQEQRDYILSAVPMQNYVDIAGADHLYFYSYYSLGNMLDTAQGAYEYIQKVKEETGHDKVNIVSISQGGSVANMLFEIYKSEGRNIADDVNRIVFIVPALNGSTLIGEIYQNGLLDDDDALYGYMFPMLMGNDWSSYLINLIIRFLPKDVLNNVLDEAFDTVIGDYMKYSTMLWGLVPSENYTACAEKYLSDEDSKEIKRQADIYYNAQLNSDKNILAAIESGVEVFDIVGYNYSLYPIVDSWDDVNADGIIQLDSASMGAFSNGVDKPLGDNYKSDSNCNNSSHNHIDPHGVLDAGTGLLPDHTFYFYKQDHEETGSNDVVMKLAIALLTDPDFKDVYSYPDKFPQFNTARTSLGFINDVNKMRSFDTSTLDAETAAELNKAIARADNVIGNTVVDTDEFNAAKDEFYSVRAKIRGEEYKPEGETSTKDEILTAAAKLASRIAYIFHGPKGWFD